MAFCSGVILPAFSIGSISMVAISFIAVAMTSLEEGLLSEEEKFSSIFILVLSLVFKFAVKNFVLEFKGASLSEKNRLSYF
jgi:hypothetical protein